MSLLALLAAQSSGPAPEEPGSTSPSLNLGARITPKPSSLTAPYNAAQPLNIPTPDGTGIVTHPGVEDMGVAGWNGYRYWMGFTPFFNSTTSIENPCIAASNDGETWVVPAGLTNPIDPHPGGGQYNSDTDLVYDPSTGRMWCFWRASMGTTGAFYEEILASWSTNGSTWSPQIVSLRTEESTNNAQVLSPAILRTGKDSWFMWTIGYNGAPHLVRTARSPQGPWSEPAEITIDSPVGTPWHLEVIKHGDRLKMLLNARDPWVLMALDSTDGINWKSTAATPVLKAEPGGWEVSGMYRSTMAPADNGADMDIWYASYGDGKPGASWRIGRTQAPLSLWERDH